MMKTKSAKIKHRSFASDIHDRSYDLKISQKQEHSRRLGIKYYRTTRLLMIRKKKKRRNYLASKMLLMENKVKWNLASKSELELCLNLKLLAKWQSVAGFRQKMLKILKEH